MLCQTKFCLNKNRRMKHIIDKLWCTHTQMHAQSLSHTYITFFLLASYLILWSLWALLFTVCVFECALSKIYSPRVILIYRSCIVVNSSWIALSIPPVKTICLNKPNSKRQHTKKHTHTQIMRRNLLGHWNSCHRISWHNRFASDNKAKECERARAHTQGGGMGSESDHNRMQRDKSAITVH